DAWIKQATCAGLGLNDCRWCTRRGLPILPVRYAITRIDETPEVPVLPHARVGALYPRDAEGDPVPLGLDTVLDDEGEWHTGQPPRCGYILRRLRGGYLYLYDEGHECWLAYQVTDGGEFWQFPPGEPPAQIDDEPFACHRPGSHAAASFIGLPYPLEAGRVWFAYLERPWSLAQLERVAGDEDWRKRHLQCFDVEAWLNDGVAEHAFAPSLIGEQVPECCAGPAREALRWHRFPLAAGVDDAEALIEAMTTQARHDAGLQGKHGQAVMLAVHDEVGILEELNAYRQQPLERMRLFQAEGDNARRSLWLASVRRLVAALNAAADNRMSEVDETYQARMSAVYERLEAERRAAERQFARELAEAADEAERRTIRELQRRKRDLWGNGYPRCEVTPEYLRLKSERHRKLHSLERTLAETIQEFSEYYDDERPGDVVAELADYQAAIETDTPRLDADYAQWLVHGLGEALARYEPDDVHSGLRVTEILADVLQGGILSANSRWAWEQLLDGLGQADGLLLRAYFHNHRASTGRFVADSAALEEAGDATLELETLKSWYQQLKALHAVHAQGWALPELAAFRRSIERLNGVAVSALTAVLGHQASAPVRGGGPPAIDMPVTMRFARLLQITALGLDPEAAFHTRASFLGELDISVGAYHGMVNAITYDLADAGDPQTYHHAEATGDGRRVGGNVAGVAITDENRVRVPWLIPHDERAALLPYLDDERRFTDGGPPPVLRLDDDAVFEQQRRISKRLRSTDNPFRFLDAVFSVAGLFQAARAVHDEPDSLENCWQLIGAVAGTAEFVVNGAAELQQARRGIAAAGPATTGRLLSGPPKTALTRAAKHLGVATTVIAIIDGFREFAEAAALSRRGAVARQVYGHAFLGGIGLAGGLIALACSSAVLVPAVFTLITLVTVSLLRQLVPLNIRIWLRRSLYGVQQEDYRYEPFHSAEEEQEALAMVLRGIVFDMTVTDLQGSVGGTLMLADAYQSGVAGTIAWTEEAVRTP
ncbi:T6SS effector BTH_I2691 family protein, partial [Arhodomonas sp. KWT2]|uniref:T6SS effector BTH_I2691 family protein n=1 Tax=Arhodomonas sp. KWT2 TaxID=3344194 RepID=UPI0035C12145